MIFQNFVIIEVYKTWGPYSIILEVKDLYQSTNLCRTMTNSSQMRSHFIIK